MNTSKSVSKQRALSTFRIKTVGVWGFYGQRRFPPHNASPRVSNQSFTAAGEGYLLDAWKSFGTRPALTFRRFRGRILFSRLQGQIARTILEERVNRRRILAGIISVGVLGLWALFLPSLHKTPFF